MGEDFEDAQYPPVRRRKVRADGLTECLCAACGRWSTYGLITGSRPGPYAFACPECLEKARHVKARLEGYP